MKPFQAIAFLAFALTFQVSAQTTYLWTNIVTGNASGSWNTAAAWNPAGPANGTDTTAQFTLPLTNTTTPGTITLDGNRTVGNLFFGNTSASNLSWTVNAGTPTTSILNLSVSSGTPSIAVTNQTATFGAPIVSTQGIIKTGAGTLLLNNTNNFGAVSNSVAAGVLQLGSLTSLPASSQVGVSSGASLRADLAGTYNSITSTITGGGIAGQSGPGALWFRGGAGSAVTWPGAIILNGNATIGSFGTAYNITLGGVISGTGNLSITPQGGSAASHTSTFTLTRQNTYAGSTAFGNNAGLLSLKWIFGTNNTLPTTTALSVNNNQGATFSIVDVNGFSQTLASLNLNASSSATTESLTNGSATIPTITLNTNSGTAFSVNAGTNYLSNLTLTVGGSGDIATTIGVGAATVLNVSNVTWNSSYLTDLGRSAVAVVNLYKGTTLNNSGELLMGYGNANGISTLNVNTGVVVNSHYIRVGNNARSTLNLNAGATITTDQIYGYSAISNSVNWNGALVQPNSAPWLPWFGVGLTNVQILAGGAIINTAGKNLVIGAPLLAGSPSGGLTKYGAGTLTLSNVINTYTGATVVSNGTLAVDGNLLASPVTLATVAGTTPALVGSGYVADATINAGTYLNPGRTNIAGTLTVSNLTTTAGGTLSFDLSNSGATIGSDINDLLVTTNVNLAATTTIGLNFLAGYPGASNRYVLSTYSGSASGLANLALDPALVGTRAAMGIDTSTVGEIAVIMTNGTAPSSLTWSGNNPNNHWDNATTLNWNSGAADFYSADSVVFDDSGLTNVVNLVGSLYPASVTFNNYSFPYTLTGSGQIGGAVALTLNGGQPVILDANTISTGGAILNGGNTLQIGNADTAGTVGSGDVQFLNSSSTLAYNRTDAFTLNNRIYGTSTAIPVVQVNSGALTLGGAVDNGFATATVNSGGTLVLAKASTSAIHTLGGGGTALTINAGGLAQLGGSGGDQIADARDVQDDGILDLAGLSETINNLAGAGIVMNSAVGNSVLSVGSANAAVTFSGVLENGSGTVGLTKLGSGNLTVTTTNTATGPLTIVGNGYVYLNNASGQAWAGPITFSNNTGNTPRLELQANEQIGDTSVISFGGNGVERRFQLNGFNETIGGLNDLPGVSGNRIVEAANDNVANSPATLTLNVGAGVTNSTGAYLRDAAGGANSILTLVKTGAGTQTFSGSAGLVNYSGPTTVSNGVLEVSGANSVLANSAITLAGGTMKFSGGGTLGTNLSGTGTLQVGGGTLIVTNTPNFIGNTLISAGTLQMGNSPFIGSLASPVIINNGTLFITNSTASTITLTNNLTGSGTLTTLMSASGGELVLAGDNSGWTGPITMLGNDLQAGGSGGWLVVANNTSLGSPASRNITLPASSAAGAMGIELMGNVSVGTNQTIAIGGRQIAGVIYGTNACLQNVSGNNNWAGTLNINAAGGLYALNCLSGRLELSGMIENTVASSTRGFQLFGAGDYLLDGVIMNGSSTALTQILFQGTGQSVVSGTNNTYSGPTLISSGTVLVTGLIPTNTVTVTTNGILGGNGIILGATTNQGGTLKPGTVSLGTLTISNSLTLSANSTNIFRLNAAVTNSDAISGLTTVNYGGTLIVTNIASSLAPGQSYKLFSAGSYGVSSFASVELPALTGSMAWTNQLAVNGTIAVISTITVATNQVPITFSVAGNSLNLSWPPDHLGWTLQAQTNALTVGLGTNWVPVSGSSSLTNISIPMNSVNGSVFYRLVY